jgi:hypothetical protein
MHNENLVEQVLNQTISPEDLFEKLRILLTGSTRTARIYPQKTRIIRSRCFRQLSRPETTDDLTYPPKDRAKQQRANGPAEQIFYASTGTPTTLVESRTASNEYVIAAEWELTKKMTVQEIGFINDKLSTIEHILHRIFTSTDEKLYPYTSKISQILLSGNYINGLLYPSIAIGNQSHNLAIKKSFVDEGLRCVNAVLYKIVEVTDNLKYTVEELDFATCHEKTLDWKGRKKQWNIKENYGSLKMAYNGWCYYAQKPDGSLVDPE